MTAYLVPAFATIGLCTVGSIFGIWLFACLHEMRLSREGEAVSRAFDRGYLEGLKAAERSARKAAADALPRPPMTAEDALLPIPNRVPQL